CGEIKDYLPRSAGWRLWGPGYYQGDYGKEGIWHSLSFTFYKGRRKKVAVDCSLDFPQNKNEDVYWGVYLTVNEKQNSHYLPIKSYCEKGLLERHKLSKEVVSCLKRWKVLK